MKKILITGASSYVGARIYQDLKANYQTTGTCYKTKLFNELVKLDVTNQKSVQKIIKGHKPEVIIHVANFPSPRPAMEDKDGFISLNQQSTENIIQAADTINAKIIFISSFAAINPDNIYGELKLKSEKLVAKTKAGYLILRPSLIIGASPNTENDRPQNRFLRSLENKDQEAEYDKSWVFQPTYVGHISQVIDQVISKNIWNQTIPIVINEMVTQYQIAKDTLAPFGITVNPIEKYNYPKLKEDISTLKQFELNPSNYTELVQRMITEFKDYLSKKS